MAFFASMVSNALLMSLLVAVFLLLRLPLQRRVKPLACYAMGIIVALGFLIPIRPTLLIPLFQSPKPIAQIASPALDLPEMTPYDYDFTTKEHQQRLAEAQQINEPLPQVISDSGASAMIVWNIVAMIWIAGIALSAVYHAVRHFRFRHLVLRWHSAPSKEEELVLAFACEISEVRNPPRLRKCTVVHSPMLVGLIRPTILLPKHDFRENEIISIFQHELTHLKRHDLWIKALFLLTVCLHWWNPLVWRLAYVNSADCEMSCDDAVLTNADITQRKRYGEVVLSAITRQATPSIAISSYFYQRKSDMKRRFDSMLNVHKRHTGSFIVLLCFAVTLCTGSVFALGAGSQGNGAGGVSPTTGMQYPAGRDDAYRPILVEISNTYESRPQLGMSMADIVYEYIFWGPGHTRYLALFNDYHPEMVASVRSSKIIGMALRNGWDCPIVFIGGDNSGTSTNIYQFNATHEVPDFMIFDGSVYDAGEMEPDDDGAGAEGASVVALDERIQQVFSRITTREVPHNAAVNLKLLAQQHWPEGADSMPYESNRVGLRFGNPSHEDRGASEVIIPYDENEYLARFVFDASEGYYKRWYNGEPHVDGLTGQQFIASNVIVLYADITYPENIMSQPLWHIAGDGKIDAFINGQHMAGTWKKADDESALAFFYEDGEPLTFMPGKTFVQIVPLDMQIYY